MVIYAVNHTQTQLRKRENQMKIGNINIKNNLFLGPMAGFTDYPFRRICKEYGVGLTYTEMVSAKALYYGDKKTESLLVPEDDMCAVQIFGREPDIMCHAAKLLEQRGVPVIDVNMGCPAPKIVTNGEGSALLKEQDLAVKIIDSLKTAVNIPVTVKMRMGWNSDPDIALRLSQRLDNVGVDCICIHGRTREQYYSGNADWNIIKSVKSAVKCPVIGNGDVNSREDYKKMLEFTGCDGVMIARAASARPWIFTECIKDTDIILAPIQRRDLILKHYEWAFDFYGEYTTITQMRKQFHCYIKGHPGASRLKNEINRITSYKEVIEFIKESFCKEE